LHIRLFYTTYWFNQPVSGHFFLKPPFALTNFLHPYRQKHYAPLCYAQKPVDLITDKDDCALVTALQGEHFIEDAVAQLALEKGDTLQMIPLFPYANEEDLLYQYLHNTPLETGAQIRFYEGNAWDALLAGLFNNINANDSTVILLPGIIPGVQSEIDRIQTTAKLVLASDGQWSDKWQNMYLIPPVTRDFLPYIRKAFKRKISVQWLFEPNAAYLQKIRTFTTAPKGSSQNPIRRPAPRPNGYPKPK
jgi:hypothetical protein